MSFKLKSNMTFLTVLSGVMLLTSCGRICLPFFSNCHRDDAESNANSDDALSKCRGNPGWSAIRRLNKTEYNNTIRDLLGDNTNPADQFSANSDGINNGFDNNGESLAVGPSQVNDFFTAAQEVSLNLQEQFTCPGVTSARDTCVLKTLAKLAMKAYRRPIGDSEVADLVKLVDLALANGESVEYGIKIAVQRILMSPDFLFRVELPKDNGIELTDFELASRLSYFLWNSMPDDDLLNAAATGSLHNPEELTRQTLRLLNDPKAADFTADFAEQWLETRRLKSTSPDATIFPGFTKEVNISMQTQATSFFDVILRENLAIRSLVTGTFTMLNPVLANYYKTTVPTQGDSFQKVQVSDGTRRGVLGLGAFHVSTSNPDGTSLVKRGKWVLKNLLCKSPPPPPPNIPPLTAQSHAPGLAQRKRMEMHRADPSCSSCHANMDPIGASLENFDAVSVWRHQDNGADIDVSGKLVTGEPFNGPEELAAVIQNRPEFPECFAEKIATYALGRGMRETDKCVLNDMVALNQKQEGGARDLVLRIVNSSLFTKRLPDREDK